MSSKSIVFLAILILFCGVHSKTSAKTFLKNKSGVREIKEMTVNQAFCFLNNNGTVYDINPLYNSKADYEIKGANYEINFNVCKNSLNPCKNETTLVNMRPTVAGVPTGECIALAGAGNVVSKWVIEQNTDTNKTSIKVDLPHGDTCKVDATKNYTTSMVIECDPNAEVPKILENTDLSFNSCQNTIRMQSKSACPKFDIYSFWNAIMNNKYIFGTILIIAGIFFTFFGIKFVYVTEILSGIVATSFVLIYLLFSYLQVQYSTMEFWLIIACSVLAGLIVGFFIAKFKKIPVVVLGAFLGFITGLFLYQLFLKYIQSNPAVVYWITIISCIIVFAIISWFFYDHILVLGTSFIGAYAIIRGISFMAGGFPDERQVIDLVNKGEWTQVSEMLDWKVYLYLISMLIIGVAGAIVQYKYFYESEEDQKKKEEAEKIKNDNDAAAEKLIK